MAEKSSKLMSEEDFKSYLYNSFNPRSFECVHRFRSIMRAARRGHISQYGTIAPRRPFNNRKATRGRWMNELKKSIYYDITGIGRKGTQED